MPGLSVVHGETSVGESAVTGALEGTRFLDGYATETPVSTDRLVVGRTTYPGYPIRRVETDHGTAFLEGCLYDVDDVETHVARVAAMLAARDVAALREWTRRRDGDYLVVLATDDAVAVCNDPFARLPTYHASVDGTTVVSRELAFVRGFARRRTAPLELDRLALAQQFLLGYPLGTRTTFDGVQTLPPGSAAWIEDGADGLDVERIYEHDFDRQRRADRSVSENADALAGHLATACRNRSIEGRPTVVSLSGGLDSRTVAAAYRAAGAEPVAATFQRADGGNDDDVGVAGRVAEVLDLDWRTYRVGGSADRRSTLLETKQGMNYLGMASIVAFFERLRSDFDAPVYATGDGGDKVLVDLEPSRTPESLADLVEYTIGANSRFPIEAAARLADVEEERLRESVAERFRRYPESDLARAYVHFLVRERGVNYLVHGEDRNRYYAWSVAPFYALPVFECAMDCPASQKRFRRLHEAILERFEPRLVDVPYPNFGAPISSPRYRVKQFVYDFLERYPDLQSAVVSAVTSDPADTGAVAERIWTDLARVDGAPLSSEAIAAVLADHGSHSPVQLEILATAVALAADVGGTDRPTEAKGASP